jgi:steroid 5-alpha reductase family enzyme
LFARILKDGKDSRFDEMKKNWVRFLGVWTIQAVWVFLVSSPALVAASSEVCYETAVGLLDLLGWCVWIAAFLFEVIADAQKSAFRGDSSNAHKFITTGLWAYSRHPNYFGEVCMWIGVCLSGSSCFSSGQWMAWISPLTTWILLMKVSGVPLLEKKGEKEWGQLPEYQWYMKHTPCIFPALKAPPKYEDANKKD